MIPMSSKAWVEKAGLLPKGIIGAMSLRDTKRTLFFHVIGEIKLKRGNSYLIIFLAAVLLSLFFIIFDKDGSGVRNDATIYLGLAKNVLEGHGYSDQAIAPYAPTMSREPVYPLFLSFLLFILKNNIFLIQISQAIIYAFTCLIIFRILTLIVSDERTAFKIAMINALFPALPNYTAYLIAETLFAFLLALTVWFLVRAFKKNDLKAYLFSGIFLGLATLTRAVVVLFFSFVILIIILESIRRYKRLFVSLILKQILLFFCGFLIIVLPWMMRNSLVVGKFSISSRGFNTMYVRASKVDLNKREMKMYALSCISENLAGKYFPGNNFSTTGEGYFYQAVQTKNKEYFDLKLSAEDTDLRFKEETIKLIGKHPFKFISLGFFEIIKFDSFGHSLLLNENYAGGLIKNSTSVSLLRGGLKLFGFLIAMFSIVGIILTRKEWFSWIVISSLILYFNFMQFFLDSIGRYAVPIIPYYIIMASYGFILFFNKKRKKIA